MLDRPARLSGCSWTLMTDKARKDRQVEEELHLQPPSTPIQTDTFFIRY